MAKIIKSELNYTGGGIWCINGQLDDGTVFIGSNEYCMPIISILDESILDLVDDEEGESIYDVDDCGESFIRYTSINEGMRIWGEILSQHNGDSALQYAVDMLTKQLVDSTTETHSKPVQVDFKITVSDLSALTNFLRDELLNNESSYTKQESRVMDNLLVDLEDAYQLWAAETF